MTLWLYLYPIYIDGLERIATVDGSYYCILDNFIIKLCLGGTVCKTYMTSLDKTTYAWLKTHTKWYYTNLSQMTKSGLTDNITALNMFNLWWKNVIPGSSFHRHSALSLMMFCGDIKFYQKNTPLNEKSTAPPNQGRHIKLVKESKSSV